MSRDKILNSIKLNKPESIQLKSFTFDNSADNMLAEFHESVKSVGGNVLELAGFNLEKNFPSAKNILSKVDGYKSDVDPDNAPLEILKTLDLAILQGEFGVAENGAVWLPEESMGQRMVPFIAEHLVIFLKSSEIVSTMHDAYNRINKLPDYGVFISGPSKTADIEQTLVLGAQGPLSLNIVLIN
jgi:L-lactate dehydrogenase complex protein LldG